MLALVHDIEASDKKTTTRHAEFAPNGAPVPRKRTWYRTTFFNCTVVAICAFIAPGLWAAINGLGAGGAEDPTYVNAANSVIFILQFIICIFGSSIIAWIGVRWAFVSGMIGFPIYAASLYAHVKYGNKWFIMLACVVDGIFSGIFWLTEGAIVLAYPEKHKRGKYLAYWLASRIVGQMIGGAVSLGVNVSSNQRGHISVNTYLIFISIQCLGPFIAAALSPPEKVQRSDQTAVKIVLPSSLKVELLAMWKLVCRKEILLLTPMIFQSVFSEAFFSTYNATYFTVRSRALASLVASTCVIVMNFLLGFFLDWRRLTVNTRAIVAFCLIYAFETCLYVYAMVVCKQFEHRDERPTFDWVDDGFGRAVCVYIFMLVGFNLMYDYLYWLVGTVNKNGGEIIRLSAIIRGIESCGQAISYGINSINQAQFPLSGAVAVNMSFFAVCIIPSAFVIWRVGIVNGVKVHAIVQDEEPEDAAMQENRTANGHDRAADLIEADEQSLP
ncbi:major facilitator superfamily domain-containing protein [Lophiotrema nucula]|uniref:Major facilitator superfamily domain-containing protein n=1 Tax=Lophiotrema nucula TaxID=690887 RepID=A0A6A5YW49_9PLEO|nr:major facilitator superfamily domain-containing protein [Lophiotrema nucula]